MLSRGGLKYDSLVNLKYFSLWFQFLGFWLSSFNQTSRHVFEAYSDFIP